MVRFQYIHEPFSVERPGAIVTMEHDVDIAQCRAQTDYWQEIDAVGRPVPRHGNKGGYKFAFIGGNFSRENPGTVITVGDRDVNDMRRSREWMEIFEGDIPHDAVPPQVVKRGPGRPRKEA